MDQEQAAIRAELIDLEAEWLLNDKVVNGKRLGIDERLREMPASVKSWMIQAYNVLRLEPLWEFAIPDPRSEEELAKMFPPQEGDDPPTGRRRQVIGRLLRGGITKRELRSPRELSSANGARAETAAKDTSREKQRTKMNSKGGGSWSQPRLLTLTLTPTVSRSRCILQRPGGRSNPSYFATKDCGFFSSSASCCCVFPAFFAGFDQNLDQVPVTVRVNGLLHCRAGTWIVAREELIRPWDYPKQDRVGDRTGVGRTRRGGEPPPKPQTGLWERSTTSTQIGKAIEALVASTLMLASKGRLSPFLPFADDDGLDLLLFDKLTGRVIQFRSKGRTGTDAASHATVEFNVRKKTLSTRSDAMLLAVLVDINNARLEQSWLIPMTELQRTGISKRDVWAITPSTLLKSGDRYRHYRSDTTRSWSGNSSPASRRPRPNDSRSRASQAGPSRSGLSHALAHIHQYSRMHCLWRHVG